MRGRGIFQPQKPEQICSYRLGKKTAWIADYRKAELQLTLNPLDGGRGMQKSILRLFIRLTVQNGHDSSDLAAAATVQKLRGKLICH